MAYQIEEDLKKHGALRRNSDAACLADLAASALASKSANSGDWMSILPRESARKSKERYISRALSNTRITPLSVMKGMLHTPLQTLHAQGKTAILMLDQSKVRDNREVLMVSLRLENRALPVLWCVEETSGAIGFERQKELLESVRGMLPEGLKVMLTGDRFYGTKALVSLCQSLGWGYRLRLKGHTHLAHEGGLITPAEAHGLGVTSLEKARFQDTHIATHVGILHEKGHPEPWFIAMDVPPTKHRTLDYGQRWGIEALFSDFKSRGFGITQTQLKHADRIERLILVLSIALIWAVSTGMKDHETPRHTKKKPLDPNSPFLNRASESS